jgi:hypothetical protein
MIREFNLAKMSRSKSSARKTAELRFFFKLYCTSGYRFETSFYTFPGGREAGWKEGRKEELR